MTTSMTWRSTPVQAELEAGSSPLAAAIESIVPGNLGSLLTALTRLGFEAGDLEGLQDALAGDRAVNSTKDFPKLTAWYAGIRVQCAHGLCTVDRQVLDQGVRDMLNRFAALDRPFQ